MAGIFAVIATMYERLNLFNPAILYLEKWSLNLPDILAFPYKFKK